MAVYAVGDIQGCLEELHGLLGQIDFDAGHDTLWCVGDLVNRGPDSLETLRFFHGLGERAVCVLGNHDLTLLAMAAGKSVRKEQGLHSVLEAPDADHLVNWLRHRPLLHHDARLGFSMVHAGLLPQWTLTDARRYAGELEAYLRADEWAARFDQLHGHQPTQWKDSHRGMDRLRLIANTFTRARYLDSHGGLELDCKSAVGRQAQGLRPWFEVPGRRTQGERLVFGHWSTLGYYSGEGVWGIDSGCVWGRDLTALRLDVEPVQVHHRACQEWAAVPARTNS